MLWKSLLVMSVLSGLMACGEASFVGNSKGKDSRESSDVSVPTDTPTNETTENDGEVKTPAKGSTDDPAKQTPIGGGSSSSTNENTGTEPDGSQTVPTAPIETTPSTHCINKSGTPVPCPDKAVLDPAQNPTQSH